MPDISEKDFDEKTSHVMVEIATMLRAAQATRAMAKTFKNSPDLDKKKASPAALCVIDFARRASVGLAQRLTRSEAKRDAAILAFRCRYRDQLAKAVSAAKWLSEREEGAMRGVVA